MVYKPDWDVRLAQGERCERAVTVGVQVLLVAAVLVGCGQPMAAAPASSRAPAPSIITTGCRSTGGLPDAACTPGATDSSTAAVEGELFVIGERTNVALGL